MEDQIEYYKEFKYELENQLKEKEILRDNIEEELNNQ